MVSGQKKPDSPLRKGEVVPDSVFRMSIQNDRWTIGDKRLESLADTIRKPGSFIPKAS